MLRVIYLVFNEGYAASSGDALTRSDLSGEAIRLGRVLVGLLPEPEALGLLALMLLHESRRAARTSSDGDLILLEDQDRSRWNREQITEGVALVEQALASRRFGPYTLQAAIAALHAEAPSASATDWAQIVGLYDVLMRAEPSPVVALNRAVAVAMRDGPATGLALIDAILARGELADYRLAHAARADLCRRLGQTADARAAYERALALTQHGTGAAVSRAAAGRAGKITGRLSICGVAVRLLGVSRRFTRQMPGCARVAVACSNSHCESDLSTVLIRSKPVCRRSPHFCGSITRPKRQ